MAGVPTPTPVRGSTGTVSPSGDYSHFKRGMTDEVKDVFASENLEANKKEQIKKQQSLVIRLEQQLEGLQVTATSLDIKFPSLGDILVADNIKDLDKQVDFLKEAIKFLNQKIAGKKAKNNVEIQKAIKLNIQNDEKLGILTVKKGFTFLGIKFGKDTIMFNSAKFANYYGDEIKFGDISARYGLKKGALKEANNLHFHQGQMKVGKGKDLNLYFPNELGYNELKIPNINV